VSWTGGTSARPGEYGGAVKLYYTTDAAEATLMLDGDAPFHDDRYRLGGLTLVGVIVSDRPLDMNEGRPGEDAREVTITDDLDLDEWELVEEGKPYREWCVPAELLNRFPGVCSPTRRSSSWLPRP
jgi:hypothetical protein